MFTWNNEHCQELDIPLQKAWSYTSDPRNWSNWNKEFEYFTCEGDIKTGSIVEGKIKYLAPALPILITKVEESKYETELTSLLISQTTSWELQEISPFRTRFILKHSIKGFLTPFMKWYFSKKIKKAYSKYFKALTEYANVSES